MIPAPRGNGERCPECSGKGKACGYCKGSGNCRVYRGTSGFDRNTCKRCNGKGTWRTKDWPDREVHCNACDGYGGSCKDCNGEGKRRAGTLPDSVVKCRDGRGTGKDNTYCSSCSLKTPGACEKCKGSGEGPFECRQREGSGRVYVDSSVQYGTGETVAVRWGSDGHWYIARIQRKVGPAYHVVYGDGTTGSVGGGQIRRCNPAAELKAGDKVVAVWKPSDARMYPAVILSVSPSGVRVKWDEGGATSEVPIGKAAKLE